MIRLKILAVFLGLGLVTTSACTKKSDDAGTNNNSGALTGTVGNETNVSPGSTPATDPAVASPSPSPTSAGTTGGGTTGTGTTGSGAPGTNTTNH